MQGFTYNGIHCSTYSVYYTPDAAARGSFFSDYDVIDEENGWTPGGNYYKSRVKSKEFSLSCFYDNVTYETRENIIRWLDRRTSGELIFDARQWAKYFVRPTKTIIANDYLQVNNGEEELYSGTFTVVFTAYYPFAELIPVSSNEWNSPTARKKYQSEINVLPNWISAPTIKSDTCIVFNPGTETGHSIIRFKGRTGSSPLKIKNLKNGTEFSFRAGTITQNGEWYEANSKTGRVERCSERGNPIVDFSVHDDGFIVFEPSKRSLYFEVEEGLEEREVHLNLSTLMLKNRKEELEKTPELTNEIRTEIEQINYVLQTFERFGYKETVYVSKSETDMIEECLGKYIYVPIENVNGKYKYDWIQIGSVDVPFWTLVLTSPPLIEAPFYTAVIDVDYLTIEKAQDANIEKLEIICMPEVR